MWTVFSPATAAAAERGRDGRLEASSRSDPAGGGLLQPLILQQSEQRIAFPASASFQWARAARAAAAAASPPRGRGAEGVFQTAHDSANTKRIIAAVLLRGLKAVCSRRQQEAGGTQFV